jgi:hypothetical protein
MDDPEGRSRRDQIGWESVDFYGQNADRPFSQRQSNPGDWDAWVSQGPINSHQRETLGGTDQGVRLLRNALRKGVRNLQQGIEPMAALYVPEMLPVMEGRLARGELGLQRMIEEAVKLNLADLRVLNEEERPLFANLNTPAELEQGRESPLLLDKRCLETSRSAELG